MGLGCYAPPTREAVQELYDYVEEHSQPAQQDDFWVVLEDRPIEQYGERVDGSTSLRRLTFQQSK